MQKVCCSEGGSLNDALNTETCQPGGSRLESDGVVASAALELSGSWATRGTATHSSRLRARSAGKNFRAFGASQFLRGPR